MCLGGHYGYICQDVVSTTGFNKPRLICKQLGYDPAGEESIDTCITHTQFMLSYAIKISDYLQEKLKQYTIFNRTIIVKYLSIITYSCNSNPLKIAKIIELSGTSSVLSIKIPFYL